MRWRTIWWINPPPAMQDRRHAPDKFVTGSNVKTSPNQKPAGDTLEQGQEAAVARRRNFAIISHPDAGKTTLTEKLLLYGGAIQQAGAVRARGEQRRVTSDWMELEKQRGISITSTVLQFDYGAHTINLLDTPGHQDFSEDTYRTLAAADNAVMLEDAAKGLEPQTRKLFEVCRLRRIPLFTFINKMDRPGREPLELVDEIEQELGLLCWPVNWPIGSGDQFRGVIDRRHRRAILFRRGERGRQAQELEMSIQDPRLAELVEQDLLQQALEELELLDGAGADLTLEAIHQGELTPVFFGSAMTNFGVHPFLRAFLKLALPPMARPSSAGQIDPLSGQFSGFIFKLQANMDPRHRDRVAFLRVCSGIFERDMVAHHARSGKAIRLSRPQKLFGQDRSVVDRAYPGDVIGLNNPGVFAIGDTLYQGQKVEYEGIPCFSPEIFSWLHNPNPSAFKGFRKGVNALREEGAVQILYDTDPSKRNPILAAVGRLQLEVVQHRMEHDYGVPTRLELLGFSTARWVTGGWPALEALGRLFNCKTVRDSWNRPVLLFKNSWNLQQLHGDHPELELNAVAPVVSGMEPIAL